MSVSFFRVLGSGFALLLLFAAGITVFVLGAIGLYRLAKTRGCGKPWLACIPVVNGWVVGWLYDDIRRLQGKRTGYRRLLLGLHIAGNSGGVLAFIYGLAVVIGSVFSTKRRVGPPEPEYGFVIGAVILGALLVGAAVCQIVFTVKAAHCIFKDYMPQNAAVFTVFSCFLKLYHVFFFVIRNKPSSTLYRAARSHYAPPASPRLPYPPEK